MTNPLIAMNIQVVDSISNLRKGKGMKSNPGAEAIFFWISILSSLPSQLNLSEYHHSFLQKMRDVLVYEIY
jgi:hypothetical protein